MSALCCEVVLHAGGNWNNGVHCGSGARNANNLRSNVNDNNGGRGAIREISYIRLRDVIKFELTLG